MRSKHNENGRRVELAVDKVSEWLKSLEKEDAVVIAQAMAIHVVRACKTHSLNLGLFIEGAKAWTKRHNKPSNDTKKGAA